MKSNSIFNSKIVMLLLLSSWVIFAMLATSSYFTAVELLVDLKVKPEMMLANFSDFEFNVLIFGLISLFGIVLTLKKSFAADSQKSLNRLQHYLDKPDNYKKGLKDDGFGNQKELFSLIDQIIIKVAQKLEEIAEAGSLLAGAASEMSYDATDLSEEMKKQYSSIEQVAAAVHEMTATVQEVARNTAEASKAADSASLEATDGALQSTNAIGAIERLDIEIKTATKVIEIVKKESTSIGTVLDVIRGIAEQTNLLALNAAIEAARAGEQGRGFAVVADEVRTLATRTSDSTQEIETMVKSLDQKTTEAVEKMHSATEQAKIGVDSVEQAAMSLGEIAGSIRNITVMNQQVADATQQQSEVSEDINRNVTAIQQIAESVVQSSSEISETSEKVLRNVSSLNKLVKE